MKVLHVGEYVQGGVATYLKTLISEDGQNGISNYLFMSEEKSEHDWKLPPNHIGYYSYRREGKFIISAMRAIRHKINEVQPDIVYCHSTWAGVLTRFPLLFMSCKAKIIYNAHGWAFLRDTVEWKRRIYAAIERILSWKTDKIVNVSKYEYDNAVRYGITKDKMMIIYSGISSKKTSIKKRIELPRNRINFLFVGRFDPQKGLDLLLGAINKCSRSDVHLYVIGDNVVSEGNGIEKKNSDNVTFLGWMSYEGISAWYEACDAVVMPSRWEAFGLVAIEAMKYSKPVIVSNNGALPELIIQGYNGIVFGNTEDDLNDVISKIKCNDLKQMGANAGKVFAHKYTSVFMMREMLKIYRCIK